MKGIMIMTYTQEEYEEICKNVEYYTRTITLATDKIDKLLDQLVEHKNTLNTYRTLLKEAKEKKNAYEIYKELMEEKTKE